jgi:hypothetical protein
LVGIAGPRVLFGLLDVLLGHPQVTKELLEGLVPWISARISLGLCSSRCDQRFD